MRKFTLVSAVNDDSVFESCLCRSPDLTEGLDLIVQRGSATAASAYNDALDRAACDVVVFAHQDLFLPPGWRLCFEKALDRLAQRDPNWGVLGLFGVTRSSEWLGWVYSAGLRHVLGGSFEAPEEVRTLDEVLLVVRKSSGLRFDECVPGFHLYGTDLCLEAEKRGLRNYVVPCFAIHNSNGIKELPATFWKAYRYVQRKWRACLPVQSPCANVTRRPFPRARHLFRALIDPNGRRQTVGSRLANPAAFYEQWEREGALSPADSEPHPEADRTTAKVAIMGTSVSSGNRGVLALGVSLVNLCCASGRAAEAVLLLSHHEHRPVLFKVDGKDRSIPIVPCRLSPRARPQDHLAWIVAMSIFYRLLPIAGVRQVIAKATPWIQALVDADVVGDVRGGDSFSDIYGMKRFLLGFLMAWTVLLVKGDMVQFPQTYGPFKSPIARWLARFLLMRSSLVIARDKQSQRLAQDLVGASREVLLSPDVAFSLELVRPETIALDPPMPAPSRAGVIGLNVNGLMYHGGYTRDNMFGLKLSYASFLPELVTALLREHPGELWLVPHTFAPAGDVESDVDASRMLREALPTELQTRVRIIAAEYDPHEIKGVIGGCDFFIGSRMHACIAALSQGVPCVGVAYSMKFAGVFDSVGMGAWVVDGRVVQNSEAITRVLELYRARNEVRGELGRRADEARETLRAIFKRMFIRLRAESEMTRPIVRCGVPLPQP